MKVIIRKNVEKEFNYELVEIDENLNEEILDILDIVDDGRTLKLPENSSNRKFFSIRKIEEKGGLIELSYKESIKLDGTRSRKSIEDYLTPDEKIQLENLLNKGRIRRDEEKSRPKTEREKLEEKVRRLQEKLRNLED